VIQWKVKLNKKVAKAFKRKKTLKVTIKSTVTSPKDHGKAVVKSVKVTLKRGQAKGRCTAAPHAHASC